VEDGYEFFAGRQLVTVLRSAAARDALQRAQLLRRTRQRGCDDVRRRDAHVQLPDPQAGGEKTEVQTARVEPVTLNESLAMARFNLVVQR